MTYWVTKYALTKGIIAVEGDADGGILLANGGSYLGEGKEWHRSPEAAIARAEKMRDAKLHSLRKKMSKLIHLDIRAVVAQPNGDTASESADTQISR